jgi:hypothetical protein
MQVPKLMSYMGVSIPLNRPSGEPAHQLMSRWIHIPGGINVHNERNGKELLG